VNATFLALIPVIQIKAKEEDVNIDKRESVTTFTSFPRGRDVDIYRG
jgi:hypothetical protein